MWEGSGEGGGLEVMGEGKRRHCGIVMKGGIDQGHVISKPKRRERVPYWGAC